MDSATRQLALTQYARQARISRRAANRVQELWRQIDHGDISGSWQQLSPLLVRAVSDAQEAAASLADDYVDSVVDTEGATSAPAGRVVPSAFSGIASDGRPLASLLYQPVVDWKTRLLAGQTMRDASRGSLASALRITTTQVADAGRGATGVSMAGNRTIQGYVRVVQPPACARCVLLAGTEYGWNKGFQRHPHCDCIHLPTTLIARGRGRQREGFIDPGDYFRHMPAAEQSRVFGVAGAQAIRDGADIGQVVNARRGMTTASAYGRQVQATTEGTTRRGLFHQQERRRAVAAGQATPGSFRLMTPRLMPEEIYRLAESRTEAIGMLRRFGYLT